MRQILLLLLVVQAGHAQPLLRGYMTTNTATVQMNPRITSLYTASHQTNGGNIVFTADETLSFGSLTAAPGDVWGWRFNIRSEVAPDFITLQAPAMGGGSYTLTFPDSVGSADTILLNNGFGSFMWYPLRGTDTNPVFYGAVTMGSSVTWGTNLVTEGTHGAIGSYTATNGISVTNGSRQVILMTNNWLWLNATNLDVASGASQTDLEVQIIPQHFWIATNRAIVLNSTWRRFSGAVTNALGSNKIGILRLRRAGGVNSTVWASWEPEL